MLEDLPTKPLLLGHGRSRVTTAMQWLDSSLQEFSEDYAIQCCAVVREEREVWIASTVRGAHQSACIFKMPGCGFL